MRLYHMPGARSSRVIWTLEEIGAPYDLVPVTREIRTSDEYRFFHPLGRVPVLELGDGHIFESAAICLHLADLYPASGLLAPVGSYERALAYQWTLFAMTELESRVFGWLFAKRRGEDESEHAERFAPVGDALRRALSGRQWLVGADFTVADLLIATMLANAFRSDLLTESGTLRDYVNRAQARPAYLRAEAAGA